MTELTTMKVSVSDLHGVVNIFQESVADILEIVRDLSSFDTPMINHAIKYEGKTFILRFEQTTLATLEEVSEIAAAFQPAVKRIDIFFNNHNLGCIHLSADDIINGLSEEDSGFVIGFITSQITRVGFDQWFSPNIGQPGFNFNNIGEYNGFVKTMLNRVGHDTQIGWDGKVYNFAIFSKEPFEVKVQQNFYCCEAGYLDENFFLGSIRTTVHAVFFELFRKKQLGNNVVVDINYVE